MRTDPGLERATDPAWMTEALGASGAAAGSRVTDVSVEGWIGTGQAARNARLALVWEDPDGRPSTVVVKLPSLDPTTRSTLFATGSYVKEWLFYDQLADSLSVRVPHCHAAVWMPEHEDFVLLMEDMCDSTQGDQIAGLTPDAVAATLGELVGLHAPRFADASLEEVLAVEGNPAPSMADAGPLVAEFYQQSVDGFLDRLGERLDGDVVGLIRDFGPAIEPWLGASRMPRTLSHNDCRADNLLFAAAPSAPGVVVVDWQTLGLAPTATDLAYLVATSFADRGERGDTEAALVGEYRQRMVAAGVRIDADELWRDYRLCSLYGLVITVIATVQAEQTERGDAMFAAMAERIAWQALDLEALSLVD